MVTNDHHCPGRYASGKDLAGNCLRPVKIPTKFVAQGQTVYYCPRHQTYCPTHPNMPFLKKNKCPGCETASEAAVKAKEEEKRKEKDKQRLIAEEKEAQKKAKKEANDKRTREETARRAQEKKKQMDAKQ